VDESLLAVRHWWQRQPSSETRIGNALRVSFDEVFDGQRTGRFIFEDLSPLEKLYVGTKVEILIRDEFNLPRGPGPKHLDLVVDGYGVDCTWSQDFNWLIPVEASGEICLVIAASDATALFSAGLLRCPGEGVPTTPGPVGVAINVANPEAVCWLWKDRPMPANLLRLLPPPTLQAIFAQPGKSNGQARINELFRRVHRKIISREVTLTVAQQDDSMKRARDARKHLQPEGIVILGHLTPHPRIARELGLDVPHKGQLIATRLIPATPKLLKEHRPHAVIGGSTWVEATAGDPISAGPTVPY
jgi:hypothetical protein